MCSTHPLMDARAGPGAGLLQAAVSPVRSPICEGLFVYLFKAEPEHSARSCHASQGTRWAPCTSARPPGPRWDDTQASAWSLGPQEPTSSSRCVAANGGLLPWWGWGFPSTRWRRFHLQACGPHRGRLTAGGPRPPPSPSSQPCPSGPSRVPRPPWSGTGSPTCVQVCKAVSWCPPRLQEQGAASGSPKQVHRPLPPPQELHPGLPRCPPP